MVAFLKTTYQSKSKSGANHCRDLFFKEIKLKRVGRDKLIN
jgi:hypothetical protein